MVRQPGFTFIETLFVLAVVAIVAAAAIPIGMQATDRSRAWAATRYLAARAATARMQAARRAANVALRFDEGPSGVTFGVFVDGNRNGVRTGDILAGVDPLLEAPVSLSDLFPGVAIALAADAGAGSPVQVGASGLLSFTPHGTATSGSVYVRGRDGSQFAVRVLGVTGRTRVLQFRPRTREWAESF